MIKMNFLVFIGVLEITFILLLIVAIQFLFLKKYRPYYLANTRPEQFLRKYIQRLIKQTRSFAAGFEKAAADGDKSAYKTRQNMTARLNWLVLERDFAITTHPDIRYWEDINKRIKNMLIKWKEVEIIKEPPDIKIIKLAIDEDESISTNGPSKLNSEAEAEIASLKQRIQTMSRFESMYNEMEVAYQTLENTYNDLKESLKNLELEAGEADKLREMLKQQEAQEESLGAMMDEMEASKNRLSDELEQLEQAYDALEGEATQTNILNRSDNPDAEEIVQMLNQQEQLLGNLKNTIEDLAVEKKKKEELNNHANKIEQNNKEINHSMQMLELERERLADEIDQLQEDDSENIDSKAEDTEELKNTTSISDLDEIDKEFNDTNTEKN